MSGRIPLQPLLTPENRGRPLHSSTWPAASDNLPTPTGTAAALSSASSRSPTPSPLGVSPNSSNERRNLLGHVHTSDKATNQFTLKRSSPLQGGNKTCSIHAQPPPPASVWERCKGVCKSTWHGSFGGWKLGYELLALAVILFAIILGAIGETFNITPLSLSSSLVIDTDAELALLGGINKILDLCVEASLEHTAALCITIWMLGAPHHHPTRRASRWLPVRGRGAGAAPDDLELAEELTKPWAALLGFVSRWHRHGFRASGRLRFLCCMSVSTAVLFLGVGINTVGMPKERWYPDPLDQGYWISKSRHRDALTVHTPLITLTSANWSNVQDEALSAIGGDKVTNPYAANEFAYGVCAGSAFQPLYALPGVFGNSVSDWYNTFYDDNQNILTGAYSDATNGSAYTVSLQKDRITSFYEERRANGTSYAQQSVGFTGTLNMTMPMLNTTCVYRNSSADMEENALNATLPSSPQSTSFHIILGPSSGLSFSGANCSIEFTQVFFGVAIWIIDNETPWASITSTTSGGPPAELQRLPATTADSNITRSLAEQFSAMLPALHGLVPSNGFVPHSILISRTLTSRSGGLRVKDDYAGLGPVFGTLASQLLNLAVWTADMGPKAEVTSFPVQWQVYGSGPWLPWEWVVALALAVVLLAVCYGMVLTVLYRNEPGIWNEPVGAIVIANNTETLDQLRGTYKDETELDGLKENLNREGCRLLINDESRLTIQT